MSAAVLSEIDRKLLAAVQVEVPLSARPYDEIAARLDVPPAVVIDRLRTLRHGPGNVIRQIGAIFDSASLGYRSTLVAARIPPAELQSAAMVINRHPGVSHNYQRDHEYNLWYTLAIPPTSKLGLEETVNVLHRRSGAIATRMLPTLKLFKIGVKLDLGESAPAGNGSTPWTPGASAVDRKAITLSSIEIDYIRVLQRDLPIIERPFDDLAHQIGVSVDQLLTAAEDFRRRKLMRRFSAVLRHRQLGFDANAMGVWAVPEDKQDTFGNTAAGFEQVSHCYLRPSYPDWPYNIFTMIHTQDREQATGVLKAISAATGVSNYRALYSTHEFKKVRVQYFTGDVEAWEVGVDTRQPEPRNVPS